VLQFRESKGVSPSRQVLKDYANRIEERTIEPKALSVGRQLATLRAENQKLRAELRRAERRVAKLQAELERVRGTTAA
jgi:predicted RNase H-like nuclease (RuvC/YqgF family)